MIPKVIHYCWFGNNPKTKLMESCIESWKKYCQDYEIIEWNENNFDINMNEYTRRCYNEKKWAFLSDYVRLYVVEKYGGIYLDTDVEIVKPLNNLLEYKCFFGFENYQYVNTGLGFGAEKNSVIVKLMLNRYELLFFSTQYIGCPVLNSEVLESQGFIMNGLSQEKDGIKVFSKEYFNPYDDSIDKLELTSNTYSIHWFSKTWIDLKTKKRANIMKIFRKIFGKNFVNKIKRVIRK